MYDNTLQHSETTCSSFDPQALPLISERVWEWGYIVVSCPARARLPASNGLVNEVEFLRLITQNG